FCAVELPPSPKVQVHCVGGPDELSVNWTDCPGFGFAGEKLKAAVGRTGVKSARTVRVPPDFESVVIVMPVVGSVKAWLASSAGSLKVPVPGVMSSRSVPPAVLGP